MLVKLVGKQIAENIYSEEELSELSVMESMYAIRILKAVIDADGECIEVKEIENNQVYSEKYKICFSEGEYIKQ
jgi:hypothetical protein